MGAEKEKPNPNRKSKMSDASNEIPNGTEGPGGDGSANPVTSEDKPNPFLQNLRNNQVEQARSALVQTVVQRSGDTVGSIIEALENDSTGDYIMFEIFKGMTIDEIVEAVTSMGQSGAARMAQESVAAVAAPAASNDSDEDEDEDDLEDDNEFDDDGSLEEDEHTSKPPKSSKKKNLKKKASTKKKSPKKKSGGNGKLSKDYQQSILANLKEHKARDKDSARPAADIRADIGGTDVDFRVNSARLIELGKLVKFGQARGTRYARARRKAS